METFEVCMRCEFKCWSIFSVKRYFCSLNHSVACTCAAINSRKITLKEKTNSRSYSTHICKCTHLLSDCTFPTSLIVAFEMGSLFAEVPSTVQFIHLRVASGMLPMQLRFIRAKCYEIKNLTGRRKVRATRAWRAKYPQQPNGIEIMIIGNSTENDATM